MDDAYPQLGADTESIFGYLWRKSEPVKEKFNLVVDRLHNVLDSPIYEIVVGLARQLSLFLYVLI